MFTEPQQRTRTSSAPLRDLLRHNSKNWMIPLFLLMETRDDILGGAFAPTIAQALVQSTGSALSVGASIMVLCVISLAAVMAVKEPKPRWRAHAPPVRS
ncbi:hypothetical protein AB0F17_23265 [Nonomuraea sp. NPDC026600]|uniref:hypothetical protein n=1 Tax=Nonomuraea sp. NPDC026600 TaxID=3155363 RepID=UPI0034037271